ncbi:hypothetical protein [Salinisphaera hydrothermalis]|uniref:hypothetical protein n=1 Tax=Salinisphaera hydrothermalis TaxID=563188 RepID=UPI003340748B
MPSYVYESVERPSVRYEFLQGLNEARLTHHPETGEALRYVIAGGVAIRTTGLKRSTQVNKRLPAATACGCASNAALASAVLNTSAKAPPRYTASKAARVAGSSAAGAHHGHDAGHGGGCCHGHGHK